MPHDAFICHASEDKEVFVRGLAEALRSRRVDVWYDEFSLKPGDSLRRSIDNGLKSSTLGIVILSKWFFDKSWSQWELDGLVQREMDGPSKVIVPVWLDVARDEVVAYSPSLADRVALKSLNGIEAVADGILSVWTVLTGERALAYRDLLIAAAEAGDFSEHSNDDGVKISIAIQGSEYAIQGPGEAIRESRSPILDERRLRVVGSVACMP